jgi:predicted CXXCH cytochrome family protein
VNTAKPHAAAFFWICLAVQFLIIGAASPFAQSKSLVLGTLHDLRGSGCSVCHNLHGGPPVKGPGDVCGACHTPHRANPAASPLLWVRAIRPGTYQTYDRSVNSEFAGGDVNLSQVSLLCMSCHDGAVALNVDFTGTANAAYVGLVMHGSGRLGTDLRGSHPIGFSYSVSQSANPGRLATVPPPALRLYGPESKLECPTCHDVHNPTNAPFLRMGQQNSALCVGCHL